MSTSRYAPRCPPWDATGPNNSILHAAMPFSAKEKPMHSTGSRSLGILIGIAIGYMAQAMPAAEERVYQPAGAPANPTIPAHWNRYHDYAQTTELLKQLAQGPGLLRFHQACFLS